VNRPPRRIRSRWWRQLPAAPPRIVAIYALVGLVWIAFSDRAVELLVTDPRLREIVHTAKGSAFIAVTSVLLYFLIRRSERRLRSLGSELRSTVNSMADAVLLVDDRSNIVEANRAALQLFGVERKEEILGPLEEWGRRFELRSLDGEPIPFERYASMRVLAGETSARYDAILRSRDGREVYVSVSASAVERPRGRRPLAVAVLRDVSPARRLDEIREEFLATAAHEFKTPLAVIKAYAQLLRKREPREVAALGVIERQVERLNRLVQHLLDTSRLRLDGLDAPRERFDLGALAGDIVQQMRGSAPAHDLRVEIAGPAPVSGDRERIARVITSLVDNAVRYSPAGGAVETRVVPSDAGVTLSVRDRGVGIPPERQAHVFERFYRAHAGTADDYGGLGLGLEMSREIVQRHGGRMWFESVPGEGSTFHFRLPLAAEDA
jgi:two-component system, OmpR family, phosphate regulon sensor histidine kinase PhoR